MEKILVEDVTWKRQYRIYMTERSTFFIIFVRDLYVPYTFVHLYISKNDD